MSPQPERLRVYPDVMMTPQLTGPSPAQRSVTTWAVIRWSIQSK